tara:strand:- start:18374 stop:19213 length:840 start_codon:yes stop_codon:yes gene_type:complete
MLIKSFSKINLSLRINKKLQKRKLHQIQSYFFLTSIHDVINIKKNRKIRDSVIFKGKFSKNINKKNNTIVNTLNILRKEKIISNYYSVIVNKKIPVFSGMGGGTSNAASIIKYFIKGKIRKNLINIVQKKIGSDLRLFFFKKGFLVNLDQVKNFRKNYNFNILIVYPYLRCSTKDIYSKVSKFSKMSKLNYNNLKDKKKFLKIITKEKNDLQLIVENKFPLVKKLVSQLQRLEGCYFSRMSGSGSACYGVFKSKKSAKNALIKIKQIFPKYWCAVAKTI